MKGSWRTTAAGFLAGLAVVAHQISALLDSDPATVWNLDALMVGLGLMGVGFLARDNKVTSEQAGASQPKA